MYIKLNKYDFCLPEGLNTSCDLPSMCIEQISLRVVSIAINFIIGNKTYIYTYTNYSIFHLKT